MRRVQIVCRRIARLFRGLVVIVAALAVGTFVIGCRNVASVPPRASEPTGVELWNDHDRPLPEVREDDRLSSRVQAIAAEFLKGKPFGHLNATVLLPHVDGTWHKGSFGGTTFWYPACCCKLPYLPATMAVLRSQGKPYDLLEPLMRPAIVDSKNVEFGMVVDKITATTNFDCRGVDDSRFGPWLHKRLYAERYLQGHGLLANQRVACKTYPSNSDDWPSGADHLLLRFHCGNRMQTDAAALLMLGICKGCFESSSSQYMLSLLKRERWFSTSALGFGLPPGSAYYSKTGCGNETIGDIAYVVLPNAREFVLAVFADCRIPPYANDPDGADLAILGPFCQLLMERMDMTAGWPYQCTISATSPDCSYSGDWSTSSLSVWGEAHTFRCRPATKSGAQIVFQADLPEEGKYEVCYKYQDLEPKAPLAALSIEHREGTTNLEVDLRRLGNRWFKAGDFIFPKGKATVSFSDSLMSSPGMLGIESVRFAKWPAK